MLVSSMNNAEIHNEIMKEYQPAFATLRRLRSEYSKERLNKRINKQETYVKDYHVKSKRKNKIMFILQKANAVTNFKTFNDVSFVIVMHYFDTKGVRAVRISPDTVQYVYNAHFFTRYNERLSLGLKEPLHKILHYFSHNVFAKIGFEKQDNKMLYSGMCRDGASLGEYVHPMMITKTFVSNEMSQHKQSVTKEELFANLQREIEEELNSEDFNLVRYQFIADVKLGLTKRA